MESGNLSTNFFVRIENSLGEAGRNETAPLKEVNEWWSLLQEDFKKAQSELSGLSALIFTLANQSS